MAALVFLNFLLALVMVALPLSALLAKILTYQLHKSIGLLLLPLWAWRLWLLARRGRPASVTLPGWQQGAARLGQGLLYALLIAVPLLGFLSAAAAPIAVETVFFLILPIPHPFPPDQALYDLLRPLHQGAAWGLVGLALGHGALAIHHHRRGLPILRRMWRSG
ncbi:MAG: cytochrome b/b6 domain-containing protein [Roseomonas sp.]|jgi:cytochrome b561|nr:cytochrome b/b6 domain-containing protein [Roseomonas sp.]MCE2762371.1 cytochrome b/b6 domain-containing protein [Acetobacteraceae bacterium]